MKLGKKLKQLRNQQGKTLQDVEADTGISAGYLSKLENDKPENPSLKALDKLATYYDVKVAYLLDDESNWYQELPEKLKKLVNEENIEYIEAGLKAKEKGYSPEVIEEIINLYEKIKPNK